MKIQIKSRWTGRVLFERVYKDNSIKLTLEAGVRAGANLGGANLDGASLVGAHLYSSRLCRASLNGANLNGAHLNGANLDGAHLNGASLHGAHLDGVKKYSESHDIFFELVHREKVENFTQIQWAIIGQVAIHRLCWGDIKKRFGENIVPILKKLADKGYAEFLSRYEGILDR